MERCDWIRPLLTLERAQQYHINFFAEQTYMQGANTAQQYNYDQSQAGKTAQQTSVSNTKYHQKDFVHLSRSSLNAGLCTMWLKSYLKTLVKGKTVSGNLR